MIAQVIQGAPRRYSLRRFKVEAPGLATHQARQFAPHFLRRFAPDPRHVQDQGGHAGYVRQEARLFNVQPAEQIIVGTLEETGQRGHQKRLAEPPGTREECIARAFLQQGLNVDGFIYVRLALLADGGKVGRVKRKQRQRQHEIGSCVGCPYGFPDTRIYRRSFALDHHPAYADRLRDKNKV